MEDKLLTPKRHSGFELGHITIQKDGEFCKCGKRGCFETYCSMKSFKKQIIENFDLEESTNSKEILEFVKNRFTNSKINDIIDLYIDDLILGISNIVNIAEPEIICFGGSFVHYKEVLFNRLVQRLQNTAYNFDVPKLVLGTLGNDAGMIGAAI